MNLLRNKKYLFFYLLVVVTYILLRFSLITRSLDPFMFCDEYSISGEIERMITTKSTQRNYRFMGTNTVPLVTLLSILSTIGDPYELTINGITVLGRIIYLIILPIIASYMFGILTIEMFNKRYLFICSQVVFLFTPTVFFRTITFYPDSYLPSIIVICLFFTWRLAFIPRQTYAICFGVSAALMISAKPTTMLYLPVLALIIWFGRKSQVMKLARSEMLSMGTSLLIFSVLINVGAFLDPRKLFYGMRFNYQNYTMQDFDFSTGIIFFIFSLFPSYLMLGLVLYLYGITHLLHKARMTHDVKIFILNLLAILIPFGYIIFWSNSDRLIVRNFLVAFPAVALGLTYGIAKVIETKQVFGKLLIAIFVIQSVSSFVVNLKIASSDNGFAIARQLKDFVPVNATIGINQTCNGLSPAELSSRKTIVDDDASELFDYYLIDSRAANPYVLVKSRGLFFDHNLIASHFNHFDNSDVFAYNGHASVMIENYQILKVFMTDDAIFYLLRKHFSRS